MNWRVVEAGVRTRAAAAQQVRADAIRPWFKAAADYERMEAWKTEEESARGQWAARNRAASAAAAEFLRTR